MDNNKYELYEDRHHQQQQDLYTEHFVPLKLNDSWAGRRLLEALSQLPPNKLSSSLDVSVVLFVIRLRSEAEHNNGNQFILI